MISMRKQLFGLLSCVGVLTIVVTAVSINVTTRLQFEKYVQNNIQKTSNAIVERLKTVYDESGTWSEDIKKELLAQTQMGNFAIAILDENKEKIWGMSEKDLSKKIEALDYPFLYGEPLMKLQKRIYTFEDIPIETPKYGLVGYARIGYYPSFLLANDDILFQTSINQSIIWSGLIGLSGCILIGAYITRLFTKPIFAIATTSAALAEGKYTTRYMKESRIKELENLRYSMNYLAGKLEQQDTLRRKLISDVSHEIRTPLHILQSNLEAMIDGIYPIDEDQMQVLYQEVVRFSSLLSSLDKLKNIETDQTELKLEEVYLNTALKDIYTAFKVVAKERKIKYTLDIKATEQITILADVGALKQILMNLLSNAFKFTQEGSLGITTHMEGRNIHIKIKDTGIGIAKEDLPYIFERMYRGDKSREKYEGSGIGLTIVKKLVTMHSGKIEIESTENEGTEVTIILPLCNNKRPRVDYKDLDVKR